MRYRVKYYFECVETKELRERDEEFDVVNDNEAREKAKRIVFSDNTDIKKNGILRLQRIEQEEKSSDIPFFS